MLNIMDNYLMIRNQMDLELRYPLIPKINILSKNKLNISMKEYSKMENMEVLEEKFKVWGLSILTMSYISIKEIANMK